MHRGEAKRQAAFQCRLERYTKDNYTQLRILGIYSTRENMTTDINEAEHRNPSVLESHRFRLGFNPVIS